MPGLALGLGLGLTNARNKGGGAPAGFGFVRNTPAQNGYVLNASGGRILARTV